MAKSIDNEEVVLKGIELVHHRCIIALCIFQAFTWACTLIGTPIAQFSGEKMSCHTLWGYKDNCGDVTYTATGSKAFECSQRAKYMHTGAVFGVLSCVFSTISLISFTVSITRVRFLAWIALPFMLLTIITTAVTFGVVATVSNKRMCETEQSYGTRYADLYSYTAGFAFFIIAFFLQLISFGLLIGLKITGW